MDYHYLTKKITLIPQTYFAPEKALEVMTELFGTTKEEVIRHSFVQPFNAYIVYSLPETIISKISDGENIYPFAIYLIEILKEIKEYNKVIFHYSKKCNLVHIIISKGDNLQLVNTYNANSFENAVYFLFLAIKQTIINPLQTNLQVCNNLSTKEIETIEKYFSSIKTHHIDSKINLL